MEIEDIKKEYNKIQDQLKDETFLKEHNLKEIRDIRFQLFKRLDELKAIIEEHDDPFCKARKISKALYARDDAARTLSEIEKIINEGDYTKDKMYGFFYHNQRIADGFFESVYKEFFKYIKLEYEIKVDELNKEITELIK